jgi:hypothetical protein
MLWCLYCCLYWQTVCMHAILQLVKRTPANLLSSAHASC